MGIRPGISGRTKWRQSERKESKTWQSCIPMPPESMLGPGRYSSLFPRTAMQNRCAALRHLDGRNYFTEAMPARWTGSPEPTPLRGVLGTPGNPGKITGDLILWDAARMSVISKMDIPAGEQEDLDISVRLDADSDAYGFNNESYQFNWRHPRWKLPKGRYLVAITIRSEGQKLSGEFLMNNDLDRDQFRLDVI
jgi:hypothetical protein